MTGTCRVTTTNRALLKVTLQDITPREGVSTEHTHIRAVTSVCSLLDWSIYGKLFIRTSKEMALQMLRMEVSLCTMRTREFSIGIFSRNHCVLGGAGTSRRYSWTTGSTGQNTSSALGAYNVSGWFHLLKLHHIVLAITRRHAAQVLQTIWWHWPQSLGQPALSWSWSNWLGVGHGGRRLRHH